MTNALQQWLTLIVVAALTVILMIAWQTQLIAPSTPAGTGFEQARAFTTLSRLLAEGKPHIAGSPENAVIRDRLVEELKSYGYQPEIQAAFQCAPPDRFPGCTQVDNVIAVHEGTGGGKAVLVTAHYDSVPAGPGASDDGAGTAVVLEFARVLRERQTKNDVVILITDGEETGLRGAVAFAQHHPLMKTIGVVVNVEARGASGPSMMFETGPNNAALMDLFAKSVAHPVANSLTYEIYKLLPNDTDFTVYSKSGLTGFNFAFSNSASLYHSERDNLENLDRNTLQHHGDNLFAVAAVLADTDLTTIKASSDASYFDLFGSTLIVWPSAINLPIALIALLGVLALIVRHRDAFSLSGTGIAIAAVIATPILLFAAGWLLAYPLGIWPGVHPIDHPEPWPARIALAAAALLVAALIAAAASRVDTRALLLANWLILALLGAAIAYFVTGAAFLMIWPALVFVIAGWVETFMRANSLTNAARLGFALTAFMWVPYLLALELVLGFNLSQYKIPVLTPFVLALIPVLAPMRWLPSAALLVASVVAAAVATQTPAYAYNHPRGLNITYLDDRSATPRWFVGWLGAPDEAYIKANGFPATDAAYRQFGLIDAEGRYKAATDLKLAPPTFTLTSVEPAGTSKIIKGTIHGARGGLQLGFGFAPDSGVRAIKVGGQLVADEKRMISKDPVIVRISGVGDRGAEIELTADAAAHPALTLLERSSLPGDSAEAKALLASRPKDAAPVHAGNTAVVVVTLKDWTTPKP
jgi:hypothetical protein